MNRRFDAETRGNHLIAEKKKYGIFFSTNQDSSVFLGFCSTLRLRHARVRPVEGFSRAPFAFKDSVIE